MKAYEENVNKKLMYVLMCILVVSWGLDYVVAKKALAGLDPLTLVFFKHLAGLAVILAIRFKKERGPLFRLKDIWMFAACAVFGGIMYFYCEYTAMDYMPVSLISIVLSFVPVVSIMIEAAVYKRRTSMKAIAGVFVCIFGITLIIGVDWEILLQGRLIGYLLAFGSVFCWNIYNFVTAALHERYTTIALTFNQLVCVCVILLPYALYHAPPLSGFTPVMVGQIAYLGLMSCGAGLLIQVRGLLILGPTVSALFANFLPVAATFLGWLFLGEVIAPVQFVGGAIVIAAGCFVIKEKDKALA
ncbi:MAG: DMT family transporter [Clostridiales bacterium]|nr:DMT family transporter [Clostridiales bacterium]